MAVTIETASGLAERRADYLICTLPASTLRDVVFTPNLPEPQHRAVHALRYGAATRVLLQFERRFWRRAGRPNAFGSDQAHGAVWDGNEQQRGAGILSLLAGGGAAREVTNIIEREGIAALVRRLRWLGDPAPLLASRVVRWHEDPWVRGGYAYFDPSFDPRWRDVLSQPFGRVLFAGEHTSLRWQGYMNGAVETGQRAAREVVALATG